MKNGAWRLLRLIVEAIIDAVTPKPDVRRYAPRREIFNAISASHAENARTKLQFGKLAPMGETLTPNPLP